MLAGAIGFITGMMGSIPLTGPIALLVFKRVLSGQTLHGLTIALGGAIPEAIYCFLAFHGFGMLLESYPELIIISKSISGFVLLGLGIYFFKHTSDKIKKRSNKPTNKTLIRDFIIGFSISAFNPVIIFSWAIVAATMNTLFDTRFSITESVIFSICVVIGIETWFYMLAAFITRFRKLFEEKIMGNLIRVIAIILMLTSGYFFFTTAKLLLQQTT